MVGSIILSGNSTISSMALSNPDRKQFDSKTKQIKRWLQNKKTDYASYFLPFAKQLLEQLSSNGILVFSIDGSAIGRGCMCLMLSVIYKEKAIPVVWKTFKSKKGHLPENAHIDLLKKLESIVPSGCRVVLTGDGEFDGCDWMKTIRSMGYDYVMRTGKNARITEANWDVFQPQNVRLIAGTDLFFEDIEFTRKKHLCNLLIWHKKGHQSPLYLLTNLDYPPRIKQLYKKRFKIEPFFRDQKSKGFNIQKSGLSCPQRLDNLLLATCMAYVVCIMGAVKAFKSIFYKEIARSDGDFLSLFQLGLRYVKHLIDLRQWRSFSIKRDLKSEKEIFKDHLFCVPF